jgi:hypothetical protein
MKLLASIGGALLLFSGISQASIIQFTASLSGPAEEPPVESPGTGQALVIYDSTAHTMRLVVTFADLLAPVTAAHIHAPTPAPFAGVVGVATQLPSFVGFPLGVTAGSYDHTFDLTLESSFNPSYILANTDVAGAEAALLTALAEGRAYLNIHTSLHPGGEIRGFLTPVPDASATGGLLALAMAGLLGWARFFGMRRD